MALLARLYALKGYLKYFWLLVKVIFRFWRYGNAKKHALKEIYMTGLYDINNTIEVIALGLGMTQAVIESIADDGKITWADASKLTPVTPLVVPAIKDIALVPKEIADIQEDELIRIKEFIITNASHIPGINEKWLKVASGVLKMGLGLLETLEAFKKSVVVA